MFTAPKGLEPPDACLPAPIRIALPPFEPAPPKLPKPGPGSNGASMERLDCAGVELALGDGRRGAFDRLGDQLAVARQDYEAAKALDDEIFGEEFEVT